MKTATTRVRYSKIDPQKWLRLKSIVADALELTSPQERTRLIQTACAEDRELLREAESLVAEANSLAPETSDELEECAEHATRILWEEDGSRRGERIGAYAIVREIGHGGMGTVYLAERADGAFEKRVAIKVLKRGTDTDEVLRRFRSERHILARLEHPNIARLLDGGTTGDGLPYFVMEYVEGSPATRYAREHRLPIDERLRLFLKICGAVENAHSQRVIHRDLKPSNILVDVHGEPKLLDFGIAKLLAGEGESAHVTLAGRHLLTPSCASPEQARGEPATRATDIYGLGALLYELLTDRPPHRFGGAAPSTAELIRVLTEEEPALPSRVASDRATQRKLRGALDDVVLCALNAEPARRFSTVTEFADHIRRYLDGQPVRLMRVHAVKLRRWIMRNKVAATAATLILAAFCSYAFLYREDDAPSPSAHTAETPVLDKSIAVLPFLNLSAAPENAFFADGIQDAILTDLGKVADLKVISRTSVAKYTHDQPRDVREISRHLGVAHLLEGTVQRSGQRVRISAKLIDARNDVQTWADTYDRDLADVFQIQSEIARAIVGQLQARLLPRERADIGTPLTQDLAAYEGYLKAKQIVDSYLEAVDPYASLTEAIRLLHEATRRDPKFVSAYCYIARAHSIIAGLGLDVDISRAQAATAALEKAFALEPRSPEAHLANAEHCYRGGGLAKAEKEIEQARTGLPNSAPLHILAGNIYRRQGRWDLAERSLLKAVELDPRNVNALIFLTDTQTLMRKFNSAAAGFEAARELGLDTPSLAVRRALLDLAETGRTEKLEAALAAAPPDVDTAGSETPLRVMLALIRRDYDAASATLAASERTDFQDVDVSFYYPRSWYEAIIARARGDHPGAQAAFTEARRQLEARMKRHPGPRAQAVLAQVYAGLGLKELAVREAAAAAERRPVGSDGYDGPLILQGLAQVYTWTGEHDRAVELVEKLLTIPGYLSYGYLLTDPAWEPLRGDERFQKLVLSHAPRP